MKDINELLDSKNLSRTPCRVEILKILLEAPTALSESEIREKLAYNFDRTTVYRTLRSFISQGVIHTILVEGRETHYAISDSNDSVSNDYQVHFSCNNCEGVYCLSHHAFATPTIPDRYISKSFDLMIRGICEKCID